MNSAYGRNHCSWKLFTWSAVSLQLRNPNLVQHVRRIRLFCSWLIRFRQTDRQTDRLTVSQLLRIQNYGTRKPLICFVRQTNLLCFSLTSRLLLQPVLTSIKLYLWSSVFCQNFVVIHHVYFSWHIPSLYNTLMIFGKINYRSWSCLFCSVFRPTVTSRCKHSRHHRLLEHLITCSSLRARTQVPRLHR
jgi:hypothetical protein